MIFIFEQMLQIAQNIKLIRGLAGKTQPEFAILISENLSNLKTYETKGVMPKLHIRHRIAKIGGVTVDDLLNKALTPDDITINLKVEKVDKVKNGSVIQNKAQHAPNSQNQGLDLISEVTRLMGDNLTVKATLKVIISELVPLIAKATGRSHASVSAQMEKDISVEILNLKTLERKQSGD